MVKILDMGLATVQRESAEKDNLTARFDKGAVLGTADFMAPEQVIEPSSVDIRADIYSLGATLYTLVNGKPPFSGSCTQKLVGHTTIKPASLTEIRREIPKGLSAVVDKMMAKDPALRFQTPAEVVEALNPWLEADTIPLDAQQTRKMPGTAKSGRRKLAGKKSKVPLHRGGRGRIGPGVRRARGVGPERRGLTPGPTPWRRPRRRRRRGRRPGRRQCPAPTPPTPTPAAPRDGARLVYEIDFAKGPGFLAKYEDKQRVSDGRGLPAGLDQPELASRGDRPGRGPGPRGQ